MKKISIFWIVFLIFMTLKLAQVGLVADWSWWWVWSPIWIPFIVGSVFYIIGTVGLYIVNKLK